MMTNRSTMAGAGEFLGRLLVASLFWFSGVFDMALNWPAVARFVGQQGLPGARPSCGRRDDFRDCRAGIAFVSGSSGLHGWRWPSIALQRLCCFTDSGCCRGSSAPTPRSIFSRTWRWPVPLRCWSCAEEADWKHRDEQCVVSTRADQIEAEIPRLRRYAAALLRGRGDADDLVQDCLERALARWAQRHADEPLRPWLFAIMHNLFVSQRRRQAFLQTWRLAPAERSAPAEQEGRMAFRDVLRALDQLDVDQRAVLLLVGVEDFSYAEAAKILDCPVGTVMSRLCRGRNGCENCSRWTARWAVRRVK